MHLKLKAALIVASVICALGTSSVRALVPDDTNPDGSIKTNNFLGHPTYDFSIFTVVTSGDLNDTNNTFTGPSVITGNVAVGGHGNFSASDGTINGDIYVNRFGHFTKSGPTQHNGTVFQSTAAGDAVDMKLTNALAGAKYLSQQAAMESSTSNYTVTQGTFNGTNENGNQNVTLNTTGKVVLNLQNFVMTGGTFTLQGTAMSTYIINVTNNFSLDNSKVVLSGGLMASHVLFNIIGTGPDPHMNQGTSLQGIFLAYDRKVSLSGGKVFGKVIAEQLAITSGGQAISQ
jgi:hypothetical protein